MKFMILFTAVVAFIGLTVGGLVSTGRDRANAQQPIGIGSNLGNHHQEVELALFIGETKQLPIPAPNRSVYVVYSLSNVFDADTGNAEEPATGSWVFFYDSANNLGPETQDSESPATGCNARAKVRIEDGVFVIETINGSGPICREDTPARLHVTFWY